MKICQNRIKNLAKEVIEGNKPRKRLSFLMKALIKTRTNLGKKAKNQMQAVSHLNILKIYQTMNQTNSIQSCQGSNQNSIHLNIQAKKVSAFGQENQFVLSNSMMILICKMRVKK